MIFGTFALEEAEGTLLAHSQRFGALSLKKGRRLNAADIAALKAAGVTEIAAAKLGEDDVHEDAAAAAIAKALAGANAHAEDATTGRVNLFATTSGLLTFQEDAVHALNAVDPAITFASLYPFQRVTPGRMIGTIKIIPFAVPQSALDAAIHALGGATVSVTPWRARKVAAISTMLPALKPSIVDKTLTVFQRRMAEPGAEIAADVRVAHDVPALVEAIDANHAAADLTVVFGASAMVDPGDVIPEAIRQAGGRVIHAGMPVDPGNLLVLGELSGKPVVGAPGCARSPKHNGFDMVLDRLLAGLSVGANDITRMGVGGLLTDTAARPRPRRYTAGDGAARKTAALVLAAGRSSRMGPTNKLLEPVDGIAMVRRVTTAALDSNADHVVVITGHQAERVQEALQGLNVEFVHNPDFAEGLSTSLRAGLEALATDTAAALILLGDMPLITAADCNAVLEGLGQEDALIAIATADGSRGNPVAWSSRLFSELKATEGDAGGRALMSRYAENVAAVEIGAAARLDADTPDALEAIRNR